MSTKDTAVVPYDPARFAVEMPPEAPPLAFDVNDPGFNWRQVMPSNYWNRVQLKELKQELGGWPVFTPKRIVIKPVYDPSDYEDKKAIPPSELAPKIVLEFVESCPALVFNKSRCEMAQEITGTPDHRQWANRLGKVILSVGEYNDKVQIILERAPVARANGNGKSVDELNKELFG